MLVQLWDQDGQGCDDPGLSGHAGVTKTRGKTFRGFFTWSQTLPHVIFSLVFPIASARVLGPGIDSVIEGPECLCLGVYPCVYACVYVNVCSVYSWGWVYLCVHVSVVV